MSVRFLPLLALTLACTTRLSQPAITSVVPESGPDNRLAQIRVGGGFTPRLETDFSDPSSSQVVRSYRVLLGALPLPNVRLEADGTLVATVPAGMVPGSYDLTVRDPWGQQVTRKSAYKVLSSYQVDQPIAGYRLSTVGDQRSYEPFVITVEAIDASGAVVTTFNGEVDLGDAPGHVTPRRLGGFVRGKWTGPVEIRGPVAQDRLSVTDDSGSTGASNVFAVAPRVPAELRYATGASAPTAGACSAPVTVTLFDEFGDAAPTAAPLDLALAIAPAASSAAFADASCTVPLVPQVPAASDRLTLYLRGTLAGPLVLDTGASGLAEVTQSNTVVPGPPAAVAFVSGPQSVTAGACSSDATLELLDAFGNVTSVAAGATVALASNAPIGFSFYGGANCSGATGHADFAPGAAQTSFSFRGQLAEGVLLTASASGIAAASQPATIVAAAPASWSFTSSPQTVRAGSCSGEVRVECRDSFGNLSPLTGPTTLALSAAGLSFFADPGCTQPISSSALAAGDTSARFYLSGTLAASPLLTVAGGALSPDTQTEQVVAADPDQLVYLTPARSAGAGQCSPALTLEARDPYGNVSAPASPQTLQLSASPTSGFRLFADPSCSGSPITQTPLSGSTESIYFAGTTAGSFAVQAWIIGWSGRTQTQTVTPLAPDHLAFASAPQTVPAGNCSGAVTVESHDPFGNLSPVSASTTLGLSTSPAGGLSLFNDSNCISPATTASIASGRSSTTFYFSNTLARTVALSVSGAGLGLVSQTETIAPGPPTQLVFSSAPQTLVAGTCSAVATVQSEDRYGNASAPATDQTISLGGSSGVTFASDPSCATSVGQAVLRAGSSTASFYFEPTRAPRAQLTASIAGWTAATQIGTVVAAPATALQWDPIPAQVSTTAPAVVTVRAVDAFGNTDPGFTGTALLSISPDGTMSCDTNCTSASETSALSAGAWTGKVDFGLPNGSGRVLLATSGSLTGSSNPFDVQTINTDPVPIARFTFQPAVILAGQTVSFDASGSTDNATPSANLQVSWDFTGSSTAPPPWTPFTATKTASNTFATPGTYAVVLAVRDANGGIGYVNHPIQVVSSLSNVCVVNTSSATDDGASSCSGPFGADGKLSLTEAVRLSNALAGKQTITFSGPMTINPAVDLLNLSDAVDLYAPSSVILQNTGFAVSANVLLSNLEFDGSGSGPGSDPSVSAGGQLTAIDVTYNGSRGVLVSGSASFDRTVFTGCTTSCIHFDTANITRALSVRFSAFTNAATLGIDAKNCGGSTIDVQSTLFAHLSYIGSDFDCPSGRELLRNNTFDADNTGARITSGGGHVVRNNVFSNDGTALICGPGAGFASRDFHLLFGNLSDGCTAGDLNVISGDPSYVSAATGDHRLLYESPARDTGMDLGLDVNREAPNLFFGSAPDRGATESF